MGGRIVIPENLYPSDKELFDLIVSQKFSCQKLQKFLKSKGIFVSAKDRNYLAKVVCEILLDSKDIDEVFSFAKTKEDKIKISTYQFTLNDKTIEDIKEVFKNEIVSDIDISKNVRLSGANSPITFDKTKESVSYDQKFNKIDYSKTSLLQKEDHNFGFTVAKKANGNFELEYYTSSVESLTYISQVIEKIKKISNSNDVFNEVSLDHFDSVDQWNSFFDLLLKSKSLGLKFLSAKQVKLQLPSIEEEADEEDEVDTDEEIESVDEEEAKKSKIKTLTVSGQDLLEHPDVKKYRETNYGVKSVTAYFETSYSSTTDLSLLITLEFNQYNKFQCEVKKAWIILKDEGGKRSSHGLNANEKRSYSNLVNDTAFKIYEKIVSEK